VKINYIFTNLNAVKFGNNLYRFRKNWLKLIFVMEEFTLLTTRCRIPEGRYLNFQVHQSTKFNKPSLKFVYRSLRCNATHVKEFKPASETV